MKNEISGMVSLVNAARVAAGKGGLGWLNPSIYRYSSRFAKDVTVGKNYCLRNGEGCCATGFNASEGWDPVTGWGSLNFTDFRRLFLSFGEKLDIPTTPPTVPPSIRPTGKPSQIVKWLYRNTYSEGSCQGAVLNTLIVPVGVCLQIFQSIQSNTIVTGHKIYSCINGIII